MKICDRPARCVLRNWCDGCEPIATGCTYPGVFVVLLSTTHMLDADSEISDFARAGLVLQFGSERDCVGEITIDVRTLSTQYDRRLQRVFHRKQNLHVVN